jgi:plastocyanin
MSAKSLGYLSLALAALVSAAWGYETIEVKNGGSIKGTVKIAGDIPKDETIVVTKDKDHCGEKLPREKYLIGAGGGVKNAVVLIEHIGKGKAVPKDPAVIDNKQCAFHPHVQTAAKGQILVVRNDDPMLHNTHLYLNKRTVYNFALPRTGMEIKKTINREGLIEIECDAHDWMKGYLYVVDHPYITVTDANGGYALRDVPPGEYEIEVWHEAFGMQKHKVTVAPGESIELNIEYKR